MLILLYDAGCGACSEVAGSIDILRRKGISSKPLDHEIARRLLQGRPADRPTLVQVDGDTPVRWWSGWPLVARLLPALGARDALRVTSTAYRNGIRPGLTGPVRTVPAGAEVIGRRRLLRGAVAGSALLATAGALPLDRAEALLRTAPELRDVRVTWREMSDAQAVRGLAALADDVDLAVARDHLTSQGFVQASRPRGGVFIRTGGPSSRRDRFELLRVPLRHRASDGAAWIDIRYGGRWPGTHKSTTEVDSVTFATGETSTGVHDGGRIAYVRDGEVRYVGRVVDGATGAVLEGVDGHRVDVLDRSDLVTGSVIGAPTSVTPDAPPGACTACNVVVGVITSTGCGVVSAALLTGACAGTGPAFPTCTLLANGIFAAICAAFGASVPLAACDILGYC